MPVDPTLRFSHSLIDVECCVYAPVYGMWRWPKHPQEATAPLLTKVAGELKKEGKAKSIQSVGYCYGETLSLSP